MGAVQSLSTKQTAPCSHREGGHKGGVRERERERVVGAASFHKTNSTMQSLRVMAMKKGEYKHTKGSKEH